MDTPPLTFTRYKIKRGWYRLAVFDAVDGFRTYKLKGIGEVRAKIDALKKLEKRP